MDLTGVGTVILAGAAVGGPLLNVLQWLAERRRERRRQEPPAEER